MSIKVMNRVWEHSAQKGSALLLLLAIADSADDNGLAWPGMEALAHKTRLSRRQVLRLVQQLDETNELAVISRKDNGRPNKYHVLTGQPTETILLAKQRAAEAANPPTDAAQPPSAAPKSAAGCDILSQVGCDKMSQGGCDNLSQGGCDIAVSQGCDIAMSHDPSITDQDGTHSVDDMADDAAAADAAAGDAADDDAATADADSIDAQQLWGTIQAVAATSMHPTTYHAHIADTRPVHAGRDLILVVPAKPASIGWINRGLRRLLDQIATECYADQTGRTNHRYSVRAITAEEEERQRRETETGRRRRLPSSSSSHL